MEEVEAVEQEIESNEQLDQMQTVETEQMDTFQSPLKVDAPLYLLAKNQNTQPEISANQISIPIPLLPSSYSSRLQASGKASPTMINNYSFAEMRDSMDKQYKNAIDSLLIDNKNLKSQLDAYEGVGNYLNTQREWICGSVQKQFGGVGIHPPSLFSSAKFLGPVTTSKEIEDFASLSSLPIGQIQQSEENESSPPLTTFLQNRTKSTMNTIESMTTSIPSASRQIQLLPPQTQHQNFSEQIQLKQEVATLTSQISMLQLKLQKVEAQNYSQNLKTKKKKKSSSQLRMKRQKKARSNSSESESSNSSDSNAKSSNQQHSSDSEDMNQIPKKQRNRSESNSSNTSSISSNSSDSDSVDSQKESRKRGSNKNGSSRVGTVKKQAKIKEQSMKFRLISEYLKSIRMNKPLYALFKQQFKSEVHFHGQISKRNYESLFYEFLEFFLSIDTSSMALNANLPNSYVNSLNRASISNINNNNGAAATTGIAMTTTLNTGPSTRTAFSPHQNHKNSATAPGLISPSTTSSKNFLQSSQLQNHASSNSHNNNINNTREKLLSKESLSCFLVDNRSQFTRQQQLSTQLHSLPNQHHSFLDESNLSSQQSLFVQTRAPPNPHNSKMQQSNLPNHMKHRSHENFNFASFANSNSNIDIKNQLNYMNQLQQQQQQQQSQQFNLQHNSKSNIFTQQSANYNGDSSMMSVPSNPLHQSPSLTSSREKSYVGFSGSAQQQIPQQSFYPTQLIFDKKFNQQPFKNQQMQYDQQFFRGRDSTNYPQFQNSEQPQQYYQQEQYQQQYQQQQQQQPFFSQQQQQYQQQQFQQQQFYPTFEEVDSSKKLQTSSSGTYLHKIHEEQFQLSQKQSCDSIIDNETIAIVTKKKSSKGTSKTTPPVTAQTPTPPATSKNSFPSPYLQVVQRSKVPPQRMSNPAAERKSLLPNRQYTPESVKREEAQMKVPTLDLDRIDSWNNQYDPNQTGDAGSISSGCQSQLGQKDARAQNYSSGKAKNRSTSPIGTTNAQNEYGDNIYNVMPHLRGKYMNKHQLQPNYSVAGYSTHSQPNSSSSTATVAAAAAANAQKQQQQSQQAQVRKSYGKSVSKSDTFSADSVQQNKNIKKRIFEDS